MKTWSRIRVSCVDSEAINHTPLLEGHTCDVASRPAEAADESELYRIAGHREHDRYGRGCRLGGSYVTPPLHQLRRQRWQAVIPAIRPPRLDHQVLALH